MKLGSWRRAARVWRDDSPYLFRHFEASASVIRCPPAHHASREFTGGIEGDLREIALSFELGIWGNYTLGPPRLALALEGRVEEAL